MGVHSGTDADDASWEQSGQPSGSQAIPIWTVPSHAKHMFGQAVSTCVAAIACSYNHMKYEVLWVGANGGQTVWTMYHRNGAESCTDWMGHAVWSCWVLLHPCDIHYCARPLTIPPFRESRAHCNKCHCECNITDIPRTTLHFAGALGSR